MDRIKAIAGQIESVGTVLEIGCDHGYISEQLLKNGTVKKVICSDISMGSLEKAHRLLSHYDDLVEFRLGDGLKVLAKDQRVDAVIIAGMGASTIIKILKEGAEFLQNYPILVLSPQTDASLVRRFLNSINYCVKKDFCVAENGKFYDIMVATEGEQLLDDLCVDFGITNVLAPNEAFIQRIENEERIIDQKLSQIKASKTQKNIDKILQKKHKINQIKLWLKTKK